MPKVIQLEKVRKRIRDEKASIMQKQHNLIIERLVNLLEGTMIQGIGCMICLENPKLIIKLL
jgi:predicted kinase